MTITQDFEATALAYAERYGIVDYTVVGDTMTYFETFPTEGTFKATVDLNTGKETRKSV